MMPDTDEARLWRYHKPAGSALPKHLPRALSVGGLDAAIEGLFLLTNDGGALRLLELASQGWIQGARA
jgi:16S rRNA U516 pseudouridylate synthase RsuA-like enzyme